MSNRYIDFSSAIAAARYQLKYHSQLVHTEKWQGIDISKKPEAATHETKHFFMQVPMSSEDLDEYRQDIKPNLPWADDHFEERVCGRAINPGIQWAKWPWGNSAKSFLESDGMFNHNYMERYWPKRAGTIAATANAEDFDARFISMYGDDPAGAENRGIRHVYGDLGDVVRQLAREPLSRQVILPVWFPEDTGVVHGSRVPCSLFYQFFMRDGALDITYTLRSCDYTRHFRDDIYLTVRLLLWVLQQVRLLNPVFEGVEPGEFNLLITSLHMFRNDYIKEFPNVA